MTSNVSLVPGDQVQTFKALVLVHPVIFVGNGYFVEKSKTGLVHLRHASEFPSGTRMRLVHRPRPAEAPRVVQRALARLGQEDYDLFRANCQHFVNEVYTGQRRSEQVEGLTVAAVILGVLCLLGAAAGG